MGRLRRDSTAPEHIPTQAGCPCLPRQLQARRKQTGPPMRPHWPRLGSVRTTLGGAGRGSLPALPVGQGSLQTANRWLSTRTARAGFELVPKHRKFQVSSSAPSKFSSTRIYVEKGLVCTSSPFVSAFLCCSVSLDSAISYAITHQRTLRLLTKPPGLMLASTNRTTSHSTTPSLQQTTRPKLRAKRHIMHKAGLTDSSGAPQPQAMLLPLPDPCWMALLWSTQQRAVKLTPAPLGQPDAGRAPGAAAACWEART